MIKSLQSYFGNNSTYYILSFLLGWCSFYMKLISIRKLLEEISLNSYPVLLIVQGLFIFLSLRLYYLKSKTGPEKTIIFSFITGLLLVLITYFSKYLGSFYEKNVFIFSIVIFLLSNVVISLINISMQTFFSSNLSVLKTPQITFNIFVSEEFGFILGAIFSFIFSRVLFLDEHSVLVSIFAFSIFIGLFILLDKEKKSKTTKIIKQENDDVIDDNKSNKKTKHIKFSEQLEVKYPFVTYAVALFVLILCLKQIQNFTIIYGMDLFVKNQGEDVTELFSQVSMLQTGFILLFLLLTQNKGPTIINWSSGVKNFISSQILCLVIVTIFNFPFVMILMASLRKVFEKAFLNKAMVLMTSTFPEKGRLKIRLVMDKIAKFSSIVLLALASHTVINMGVDPRFIWCFFIILGVIAFVVRKKLFIKLSNFLVGNIVRSNIEESIAACYSLANKESVIHSKALSYILSLNPKPILAKAIIYALGKMGDDNCIQIIEDFYKKNENKEDIELSAINALLNYNSHLVNLFLLKVLMKIVTSQVSLGFVRKTTIIKITDRLKSTAIPSMLEIIDQNKDKEDKRILANAITILGELYERNKDQTILDLLAPYAEFEYPRRVRCNVIVFLYDSKKYHYLARNTIDQLLTSNDLYDKFALSYVCGVLNLKEFLPLIIEFSEKENHTNSTLLISLLRMNCEGFSSYLGDIIIGEDEEKAINALNQLHAIENDNQRYEVYCHIVEDHLDKVSRLIQLMLSTERDFLDDIAIIKNETFKYGLKIKEETKLF